MISTEMAETHNNCSSSVAQITPKRNSATRLMRLERNSARIPYAVVRRCCDLIQRICSRHLRVFKFVYRNPVLLLTLPFEVPQLGPANLSRNSFRKLGEFDPSDPFVGSKPLVQKREDGIRRLLCRRNTWL